MLVRVDNASAAAAFDLVRPPTQWHPCSDAQDLDLSSGQGDEQVQIVDRENR